MGTCFVGREKQPFSRLVFLIPSPGLGTDLEEKPSWQDMEK